MKNQLTILTILIFTYNTYSQSVISGTVVSNNGEGIPYVAVYVKNSSTGTYSDEAGAFRLAIQSNKSDTLSFSSVGYFDYTIPINKFENDSNVMLKEQDFQLPEVIVLNKFSNVEYFGAKNSNSIFNFGKVNSSSTEIALFIENPYKEELAISTVNFFIKDIGEPKAPFRIRLYSNIDGVIGDDILNTSLIVSAKKGNAWFEIDISKYRILMPKSGLFLSMEWLYGSSNKFFYKVNTRNDAVENNKNYELFYGQNIGLTDEFSNTISFIRSFRNSWKPFVFNFPVNFPEIYKKKKLNPMFKLSISR